MKRILRMLVFSGVALYGTSLWNKGFILMSDTSQFVQVTILVALLYYIIRPVTKLILLPINFFTFGLISLVVYFFLFYVTTTQFSLVEIKEWMFSGATFLGLTIPKMKVSALQNIALSSLSVSVIIKALEKVL
jgi:uncharacterized membrane protein YvlD (DUF360 family)